MTSDEPINAEVPETRTEHFQLPHCTNAPQEESQLSTTA